MKVSETMTRDVHLAKPEQSIREAARMMSELDIGALPVSDGERLIGMITDRDIAVRAVGAGRGPDTPVTDVMSSEVMYCYEDQSIEEVTRNMGDIQLRRLPVVDRNKRLVGILSLCDVARGDSAVEQAGEALHGIARRGGQHSQSLAH